MQRERAAGEKPASGRHRCGLSCQAVRSFGWVVVLALIGGLLPCWANAEDLPQAPGEYERKTVFYVPALMYEGKVRLPEDVGVAFAEGIGATLANPRLCIHTVGDSTAAAFRAAAGVEFKDSDQLLPAISSTVLPEVLKTLAAQKLVLARSYQTEADRVSFIETKAKEFGVDAALLEKAYELCYVGVPFLSDGG